MTAIRLKQPFRIWGKGHLIPNMPANEARTLIARGIAEEVEVERKAISSPVNRMMQAPIGKRASR